jgi:hypothetical protein
MHPDAEKHEKKSSFVQISLFISIISKKKRRPMEEGPSIRRGTKMIKLPLR